MTVLDRYVKFYSKLVNIKGVHRNVLSPLRIATRTLARKRIDRYFKNTPIDCKGRQSDIIVSFTSFPGRIAHVYMVVNCLLRQTVLPKKIILWLSKNQFSGIELPENLTALTGDIFEIRFVEGDIRSHKKYHYVLQEYPQDRIMLVDDDLFYPSDMIEDMLNAAEQYPDRVICRYGSVAQYSEGKILPYNDWWNEVAGTSADQNFFFGSGGGVLFRKDLLHEDVTNIDYALKMTPIADDVWLNAMVNLAGTKKYKTAFGLLMQTQADQSTRLTSQNVGNNANDVQIAAVCEHYAKEGLQPFYDRNNEA